MIPLHPHIRLVLFLVLFAGTLALKAQDTIATPEAKAKVFLEKAQQEYQQGNYAQHKRYSDSLYQHAKLESLFSYQMLGIVNQAVYHKNVGETDIAIELYRNALSLTDSVADDYRTKIIILVNLGNTYSEINAPQKAIATMEQVIQMLDTYEDNPKIRASAYNGIASNFENLKNNEKALEYYLKTKALGEKINNEAIVATALNNMISTQINNGAYRQALQTAAEAKNLQPMQTDTKEKGWLLLNLGLANQGLENYNEALEYFLQAQQLSHEKGLLDSEAEAYRHLAEVYESLGQVELMTHTKAKYLELKNQILANQQTATKIDLEKDLSEKNEIIASKESLIQALTKNKNQIVLWGCVLTALLTVLFIGHSGYRRKSIVSVTSSTKESITNTNQKASSVPAKTAPYKNSTLTPEALERYRENLMECMEQEKPFLNAELSHTDLAEKLGMSGHHLSEVLNTGFKQNFYQFINTYRIQEAQRLMAKQSSKDSKILAIAFDSGFTSKTSFNRVFKNQTGLTPSEYRKKLT